MSQKWDDRLNKLGFAIIDWILGWMPKYVKKKLAERKTSSGRRPKRRS